MMNGILYRKGMGLTKSGHKKIAITMDRPRPTIAGRALVLMRFVQSGIVSLHFMFLYFRTSTGRREGEDDATKEKIIQ